MFKTRVTKDLNYMSNRLKEADRTAENSLRRLVTSLITEKHAPKSSDLSPIGSFLGHTFSGFVAAYLGDVEGANRRAEEINKLSNDMHHEKRRLFNEAIDIANKIEIHHLFDYYQITKKLPLETFVPGWNKIIKPKEIKYIPLRVRKHESS